MMLRTLLLISTLLLGCRQAPVAPATDTATDTATATTTSGDGVAPDSPAVAALRYLSLGDSFTAGTGATPMQSFPARFTARFVAAGREVTLDNPAVNGYTTRDLIDTELTELVRFQPNLVTLAIGANNIVRGGTAEQYRADVRAILRACLDARVAPANIVGIPQPEWPRSPSGRGFGGDAALVQVRAYNDILRDEVRAVGGRWLDLAALMTQQADRAAWAPDGLHPDAASYDQWAEQLAILLR